MDIASGIALAESLGGTGGYDFIIDVSGTKWAAITCSQLIGTISFRISNGQFHVLELQIQRSFVF